MSVTLVGNPKGGVGKTTSAINIAVWLAIRGIDVCLLDADPQASSARWSERRSKLHPQRPPVHCLQRTGDVRAAVADLAGRYSHVVIDAAGTRSRELFSALCAADVFIAPLRASLLDVEALEVLGELISDARISNGALRCRSVLSIAPTNPRINEVAEAREYLGQRYLDLLPLSETVIRERKVYRDAVLRGLGVAELTNPAALAEINGLVTDAQVLKETSNV